MSRQKKGTVVVQEYNDGWLRLRWSYQGKRHVLALGLPADPTNQAIAERKAAIIQADLATEQFDATLAKYRAELEQQNRLTVVELFGKYADFKRKQLSDEHSIDKYIGLQGRLQQFFKERKVDQLTENLAFEFRDKLLKALEPITARERIGLLRSCWSWALRRKIVTDNPWVEVKVKVPPKQKPKPFTKDEIERILSHSRENQSYSHYADFIEFCLSVGCRPGEAAGLRWRHVQENCSDIWIGEAWGRGRQKPTKTNRDRKFELTPGLQAMLLRRRPQKWSAAGLVFDSPEGKPIDDHNFRRRIWTKVLEDLDIPYRKPYNTRHTFISHALDQGWTLSEISAITGNSEETILRNYVGNPKGRTKLRGLW